MLEESPLLAVLRTKLHRPPVSVDLVPRARLLALLDRYRRQPFTLYSAPAGYGKTTLVSSWTETLDRPTAWLSLDEHDSDLVIFLNHVIAAIRTCCPDACRTTLALLNAASLPLHHDLLRCLSNDLDSLAQDVTLVLDDYHHIHETAIHDLLNELLRYPPRPLHLVVVTRHDPPFALATWRARDQMTEIRQQELRFTTPETAAFVKLMTGIDVGAKAAAILTDKMEGWVTGLRLATLMLRRQGNIDLLLRDLPENVPHILEYLMVEVLSKQPPHIQDLLLKTSILNRFCGPLCDAMQGEEASEIGGRAAYESCSQVMLEQLYKQNLFLVSQSHDLRWYRYHHAFRVFLHNQLQQRYSPDAIAALHMRAHRWLTDHAYSEEALRHELYTDNMGYGAQRSGASRHERLVHLSLTDRVENPASPSNPLTLDEALTTRELETLQLLAQRFQTKEIAEILCIAPATVKTHLKHLYQKFGVNRRRQAVAIAHAMGLINLTVENNLNGQINASDAPRSDPCPAVR